MVTQRQSVEQLAALAAGNWANFRDFAWHRQYEIDSPGNWAIVYVSNRDSGLIDESNAAAIHAELSEFMEGDDPDVVPERHNHWACGYVDGYSIRVYHGGEITLAFRRWCEIQERLSDYPLLDESDYCDREYEATIKNIENEGPGCCLIDLPEDWPDQVRRWLWDNNQSAIENRDDQGGYASREEIRESLVGLGMAAQKDFE